MLGAYRNCRNTDFIVFGFTRPRSNPVSTTPEANTLTITLLRNALNIYVLIAFVINIIESNLVSHHMNINNVGQIR
jgi:hypothetical protein